jgi:hypothetical protein
MTTRTLLLSSLSLCLSLLTSACAPSSTTDKTLGTLSLSDFEVVSGNETLNRSASAISGTGALIFPEPVTGEEFNFKLTFSLEDTGSLTWVTFSEADLVNGVETKFARAGSALNASLLFNGAEETSTKAIEGVDTSTAISLFVEAHGGEAPDHMMIFPGDLTGSLFLETDALFNSEDDGEAPGNGAGKFFGVRLLNATLTEVVGAEAKFSEE